MIQSSLLLTVPGLIHGYSDRHDGNLSLKASELADQQSDAFRSDTLERRARFLETLHISPESLVLTMQKHETVVELVLPTHTGLASANGSPFESADGLVTTHQEISLAVFSADCLPLLMVDPTTNTIAVVHAGWRGLAQGILTHALALLRQVGVKPNDLLVWIGPHIQWSCYKIRPDSPTREEKIQAFGAHEGDIKRHNDELFLDLTHSAMRQLKELGVDPNRVDIGECTACHPEKYFSYYADKGKVSGIMMGVIGWKR